MIRCHIKIQNPMVSFAHETNQKRWNDFVVASPTGHLMQAYEWGAFKAATGWKVQRVGLEQDGRIVAGAQILFRALPFIPFTLAYIPKGPVVDLSDLSLLDQLWLAIHKASRSQNTIFLKIEPNFPNDDRLIDYLRQSGFHASQHTNHPHSTVIIDLTPHEDTLLANMRHKTRQLVRRGGRNGLEIMEGTADDLPEFYQILHTTADIKEIAVHDFSFYQQVWQTYQPVDGVKLFLAKHQGQTLSAKMAFVFGDRCMHFWGGTSKQGRDLYSSYLIQWEAMKWAKRRGCRYTDLWGIPDEVGEMLKRGEEIPKDEQSGLWGVYAFKRGFGGQVESYIGTYDYVYQPLLYRLAQFFTRFSIDRLAELAERFRRKFAHVGN